MGKKVFIKTFVVTLAIMMACYGLLYISIDNRTSPADTPKTDVPVNKPTHKDSATVLLRCGDDDCSFFFILKFNGYQNAVSVLTLSPSYTVPGKQYTLAEGRDNAGIMQCVLDIKEHFGIKVDYYINCSWDGARKLLENFTEFGIEELTGGLPPVIRGFLLKNADKLDRDSLINAVEKAGPFMDNELGLGFINEGVSRLIKFNGENLHKFVSKQLKANYSNIQTNINSKDMKSFERILNFIDPNTALYKRQIIIAGEKQAEEKIKECVEE